jgi:aminoglycoside 3-N-acetyltransferase
VESKPQVTQHDIADGLRRLGVKEGDIILVHSSLSKFGYVVGGADAVVDALLEAVGHQGTAMVPTHTWDRVRAEMPVFDVRATPSAVGAVTEAFRARPGARRSLHPTHSCAAMGALRDRMLKDHEKQVTPCGARSPYQRLLRYGGKIVFLGVSFVVNTTFHALEEVASAPWLFDRIEDLYAIDYDGNRIHVPSLRHSRRMSRDYDKMAPVVERGGGLVRGRIGQADVMVVDAAKMEAIVVPLLARDRYLLLAPEAAQRMRARFQVRGDHL